MSYPTPESLSLPKYTKPVSSSSREKVKTSAAHQQTTCTNKHSNSHHVTAPHDMTAPTVLSVAANATSVTASSDRKNCTPASLSKAHGISHHNSSVALHRLPSHAHPPPPGSIGAVKCNRLSWLCTSETLSDTSSTHYFTTDYLFIYDPYFADFGPLNLGKVYRYCELIDSKLRDPALHSKRLVHCCSTNARLRPNAAFLFCAYQVVALGVSAEKAFKPFTQVEPPFLPYRDATYGTCSYHITVGECLKALELAQSLGWFTLETFDVKNYEMNSKVENGDLNWIIPNKFVAFSAPSSSPSSYGYLSFTPEDYIGPFLKMGITLVIRLNKKHYDKRKFTQHGIRHRDLYFIDGSCPSLEVIRKFIDWCENETGPAAVHCRAGLGRTGTLIGCYAIKNYGFPPNLWIAWNRICRPGSILGPQQSFLTTIQPHLLRMPRHIPLRTDMITPAAHMPKRRADSADEVADTREVLDSGSPVDSLDHQPMSKDEKAAAKFGDFGQGERLVQAKHGALMKRIDTPDKLCVADALTPMSPTSTPQSTISTSASVTPYASYTSDGPQMLLNSPKSSPQSIISTNAGISHILRSHSTDQSVPPSTEQQHTGLPSSNETTPQQYNSASSIPTTVSQESLQSTDPAWRTSSLSTLPKSVALQDEDEALASAYASIPEPLSPPGRRQSPAIPGGFSFIFASKIFRGYEAGTSVHTTSNKTASTGKRPRDDSSASGKVHSMTYKASSMEAGVSRNSSSVAGIRKFIGTSCTSKTAAPEESTKKDTSNEIGKKHSFKIGKPQAGGRKTKKPHHCTRRMPSSTF